MSTTSITKSEQANGKIKAKAESLLKCTVAEIKAWCKDARDDVRTETLTIAILALQLEEAKGREARGTIIAALGDASKYLEGKLTARPVDPDLNTAAKGVNWNLSAIEELHAGFRTASLPYALHIGALCLAAHGKFAQGYGSGQAGPGRGKKNVSRRDTFSFEAWLTETCPRLKRATAYKYMTAIKGFGMDGTATLKDIQARLKELPSVTLNECITAAKEPVVPDSVAVTKGGAIQQVFDFMREFRLAGEQVVAIKQQMDPAAYKQAVTRAYDILHQLTGEHWSPSEAPPETIDLDQLADSAF